MTQRDALSVGIRTVGVYWISAALFDWMLGLARATGLPLGASYPVGRYVIYGVASFLVGASFVASAGEIASLVFKDRDSD